MTFLRRAVQLRHVGMLKVFESRPVPAADFNQVTHEQIQAATA